MSTKPQLQEGMVSQLVLVRKKSDEFRSCQYNGPSFKQLAHTIIFPCCLGFRTQPKEPALMFLNRHPRQSLRGSGPCLPTPSIYTPLIYAVLPTEPPTTVYPDVGIISRLVCGGPRMRLLMSLAPCQRKIPILFKSPAYPSQWSPPTQVRGEAVWLNVGGCLPAGYQPGLLTPGLVHLV